MEYKIENNRIYVKDENEKIIAEINYEEVEQGRFNIYYTFVDESLRGKGIASKLVEIAVHEIERKGGKPEATCSYARRWLEKYK